MVKYNVSSLTNHICDGENCWVAAGRQRSTQQFSPSPNTINMKITRLDKNEYPKLLKQLRRLPTFLDMAGILPDDKHKFLCIIGSRRHSRYGQEVCSKLIRGLRGYPIVIVSGLALGIDSLAHRYALENNLKTVAFPGSGLSEYAMYPPTHLNLAKEIINRGGTLLSPFERDQIGTTWTFPVRNELMAAISHATLIIEARQGSGTLKTAEYALSLNREVLVVPGAINSDLSYGPHMLLRSGATPITQSSDILEALQLDSANNNQLKFDSSLFEKLSPEEMAVIKALEYSTLNSSALIETTGLTTSSFNTTISQLEIRGLIKVVGEEYSINSNV